MTARLRLFKCLTLIFLLSLIIEGYAQSPQGFSYQATIRNSNGQPVANQSVKLHILLTDKLATTTYYEEQHTEITTNAAGVASITIGEGTLKQGTLDGVPWQNGEVYIKVEVDPTGTSGYQAMGQPAKLYSVPYALFAENAKEVVSQPTALDDDPIFIVKNKAGQIVFAVYQTGVRVYVEDSPVIKGARGGFAVGGLSQTKAGTSDEYLRITSDSARIYVKNPIGKGARGGFAVGGLSQTKNSTNNYLQLTPNNYFIGQESGMSITSGLYNTFFGYQSGKFTTNGEKNIFIGYQAGLSTTGGTYGWEASNNVFIGPQSGLNNIQGAGNVFIGSQTGANNSTGNLNVYIGASSGVNTNSYRNVFIGNSTGYDNTDGQDNIFIGNQTAEHSTTGSRNIFMGTVSGWYNSKGNDNTYIGYYAGSSLVSGNDNLFIGSSAGGSKTSGSGNIFIGKNSGAGEIGSNRLYITNNGYSTPLIYGKFSSYLQQPQVVIAGDSTSSTRTFFVNGTAGGTSPWNNDSDERLKKNIVTIPNALSKVMNLRGVNFEWKDANNPEKGVRMGFIAQEAEQVIPEVVNKDGEFYSMQYAPVNALLVEAIKEQQKEIEALKAEIEAIKAMLKK